MVTFEPSATYESALERAAGLWGIEPEYWDIWGKRHFTSPEAVQAILGSMGVSAGGREQVDAAVEERLWSTWSKPLPATLVLTGGTDSPSVEIHVAACLAAETIRIEVQWEDGGTERSTVSLDAVETTGEAVLRGERFLRKRLPLPAAAPLGYHDLRIAVHGIEDSTRLIVTPERAFMPEALAGGGRVAGLGVALYGLRSNRNWGCGDFTDLDALTDWASAQAGVACIALNPLHAIANRQPYNTSPYLPACAFYRNLIYLDIERMEDFERSSRARRMRASAACEAEIVALRESRYVEYERVAALKLGFLKLLFLEFLKEYRRDTPRARQFRQYVEREGRLLDRFAVYSALDERIHQRSPDVWLWTDWPAGYQDPDSEATHEFARKSWRRVMLYKYIQWQIEIQLEASQQRALSSGMTIGLYHDLALATDRYGADLWAHRPFYVAGCRVGAPPDDFSPNGQDWSFPPPNAEQHRRDGYRLFADSIRRNIQHGGALRIDHVMRFFHLFWIPDGMKATGGTYVRDYPEELLRILALESVRNQAMIVGEDLGTVADHVRETLARFGILSYRLLLFERARDGRFKKPSEYPVSALVSATTHDLPTLAGFWAGTDIEARRDAGLMPDDHAFALQKQERTVDRQKLLDAFHERGLLPEWCPVKAEDAPELSGELHNAAVGFLASTPSLLMVLNQEDLFKDSEQQNLPGTTAEYPNWRHKMRYSIEQLESDGLARAFTRMFRNLVRSSGRG